MGRWGLAIALWTVLAACAPRMVYDGNTLARDDGAYSLALGARERVRWQLEVPEVAGAPKRYGFDYDALLYRIRVGKPGQAPEIVVVLSAHEYPERVRQAASIVERNERLFAFVELLLARQGLGELTGDPERYFFDGRSLTVSNVDPEEPLDRPGLGAAFLFGARYILEALYEIYPSGADEVLSAKELGEIVNALGQLLAGAQVQ